MTVTDPVRFIIAFIFMCCMLQVFGVTMGPCSPPPGTFDNDVSYEEWKPMYEEWKKNR